MSRLEQMVDDVLKAGRPPNRPAAAVGVPQAAAWWRNGDLGAVLALIQRADGTWHRLLAVARRAPDGTWDVCAEIGSPWVAEGWRPDIGEGPIVVDQSGASGLVLFSGVAPAGTMMVRGQLGDEQAQVDADPDSSAFVLGFAEHSADSGMLELTALGPTGDPVATSRVALGEPGEPHR